MKITTRHPYLSPVLTAQLVELECGVANGSGAPENNTGGNVGGEWTDGDDGHPTEW